MNIVAAFKVVPDDQDIQVSADGSLDYSKAKPTVSAYDLNAIEAAAQLAAANDGSKVVAMTVGGADIDDSKLKKNVFARGVDELVMIADDALADLDAYAAAGRARRARRKVGGYDVLLCGDGSADNYAQQVPVQLAANGPARGERRHEDHGRRRARGRAHARGRGRDRAGAAACVVSVAPDIALPRIPGMKDILAAGKKPMTWPPPTAPTRRRPKRCPASLPSRPTASRWFSTPRRRRHRRVRRRPEGRAVSSPDTVVYRKAELIHMKALVIAERADAARELAAGARTLADEVVLVSFGEAPEAVADKVAGIAVPEGAVLDDAADTVIAVFDAERPAVVLVEPTRHLKTIAGKLAAAKGTSVITDVMAFEGGATAACTSAAWPSACRSRAATSPCTRWAPARSRAPRPPAPTTSRTSPGSPRRTR